MTDDDLQRWWMTEVERLSEVERLGERPPDRPPDRGPLADRPPDRGPLAEPQEVNELGAAPPSTTGSQLVLRASSLEPVAVPEADDGFLARWGLGGLGWTLLFGIGLGASFVAGLALAEEVPMDAGARSVADAPQAVESFDGSASAEGSEAAAPTTGQGAPAVEPETEMSDGTEPAPSSSVPAPPLEVVSSVEPTEENPTGAVRYAIYRDGTAFLRGMARDAEAVERLESTFGEVFGADNIVGEYEINEAAPRWTEAPIYFENVVLFDLGSSELRPEFLTLLEQVSQLTEQGPFVSIVVVGRTDASGSALFNQQLAEDRAQAVVDYYVNELGVPDHRVTSEVVGEQDADPFADEATAALERRVELRVSGLRG